MLEDRAAMGPQYQALVGEPGEPLDSDQQPQSASQHSKREEPRSSEQENNNSNSNNSNNNNKDDRDDDQQENSIDPPIHLKLPLQLDFDELAGVSATSWGPGVLGSWGCP